MNRFQPIPLLLLGLAILTTFGLALSVWSALQWREYRRRTGERVSIFMRCVLYQLYLPSLSLALPSASQSERRWRDFLTALSFVVAIMHLAALVNLALAARYALMDVVVFLVTFVFALSWQYCVNHNSREPRHEY